MTNKDKHSLPLFPSLGKTSLVNFEALLKTYKFIYLQHALEIHQEMAMKWLDANDFTYATLFGGHCSTRMI